MLLQVMDLTFYSSQHFTVNETMRISYHKQRLVYFRITTNKTTLKCSMKLYKSSFINLKKKFSKSSFYFRIIINSLLCFHFSNRTNFRTYLIIQQKNEKKIFLFAKENEAENQ